MQAPYNGALRLDQDRAYVEICASRRKQGSASRTGPSRVPTFNELHVVRSSFPRAAVDPPRKDELGFSTLTTHWAVREPEVWNVTLLTNARPTPHEDSTHPPVPETKLPATPSYGNLDLTLAMVKAIN